MSDLKGYKELIKSLKKLEGKQADKIVRKGTAKASQVIRKEMRQELPNKTGNLRKNILYKIVKRRSLGGFKSQIGAFNEGFYAYFLEHGTKSYSIPKKKGKKRLSIRGNVISKAEHPGIKRGKYLETAFNKSYSRAISEAWKVMFNEIKKI